jgi:cyclophilin family peptidyl-prolyl cis-trans isomerase
MTAMHRRVVMTGAVVTALVGLLAGCGRSGGGSATPAAGSSVPAPISTTPDSGTAVTGSSTSPATTGSAQCDFTATPDQPAPSGHDEGTPPASAPRAGTVTVTLHTSQGDVPLTMPRAKAPCTVESFVYLAGKGYFNHTPCHRLTKASVLSVLQCGDPTGSGTGGPGYTIPDENPTDLPSSPAGDGASLYARGTVAMANTGQPHSGGSQFFLVYADSALPPTYAVFGTVSAAGMKVLDKVAAGGVAGGDGQDGAPKIPVTVTSTTVAG